MVNSAGGYRGTLDVNVPLRKSMAVRLNAVYSDMDDEIAHFAYRKTEAATLAATWQPMSRIRFSAELEFGRINSVEGKPRPDVDRVSNWLSAPVARRTFADWQQPGINLGQSGIASLGNAIRVTYVDNNDTLVNYRNLHTSVGNGEILFEENHPELWDRSVNDGGPGQLRDNETFSASGAVEIKLAPQTHLELAAHHSTTDTFGHLFGQTQGVRGSSNLFLSDKTTPNVGAGQLYLEGSWARFAKVEEYTSYRSTLSQELDFKKLGNYRIGLMYEADYKVFSNNQQREKWVDGNGMGLFNANPTNAANNVWRRHYIDKEGDWADYHVSGPAVSGLINGMPIDTGGTAYSAWRNQNSGQSTEDGYSTLLGAMQARYFGNRLVVDVHRRHGRDGRPPCRGL